MSWYKASQQKTFEQEFPQIELFHGTYDINLPLILEQGIVPVAYDIEDRLQTAVQEIREEIGLDQKQLAQLEESFKWARERMGESGFKVVYLSGQRGYARSNAIASSEWYLSLVHSALRIKFEDEFNHIADLRSAEFALHDEIKRADAQVRDTIASGEDFDATRLFDNVRLLERRLKEAEQRSSDASSVYNERQKAIGKKLLGTRYGDKVVILNVRMPIQVFEQKLASDSSRERLESLKEDWADYARGDTNTWIHYALKQQGVSIWEYFLEVHLDSVEPEYIVESRVYGAEH